MNHGEKYVVLVGAAGVAALAAWYLSRRESGDADDVEPRVVNAQANTLEEITITARRLAAIATPGNVSPESPRGIRNNNPGNLVWLPEGRAYDGQIGRDGAYGVYETPVKGLRALASELENDFSRKGLRTVRALITEWAPPHENDTESYIRAVKSALGVSDQQALNYDASIYQLVRSIIRHENGVDPYGDAMIYQAISQVVKG